MIAYVIVVAGGVSDGGTHQSVEWLDEVVVQCPALLFVTKEAVIQTMSSWP